MAHSFCYLSNENHVGKKYNFQCSYFYIIIDAAFYLPVALFGEEQ